MIDNDNDFSANAETIRPAAYAAALIRLLQGIVYSDDHDIWNLVLRYESPIRAYYTLMGVELYLNEADGFAFLTQPDTENESGSRIVLPHLTRRVKLSYEVTLILVLLREQLNQFDSTNLEATRLMISREELFRLMRPFYSQREDERILLRQMERDVNKVVELGFLKEVKQGSQIDYWVRSVLKSRVPSDILAQLKLQLEQHSHDESDKS